MASHFSLNRATIIGNLGKDPEVRSTGGGRNVCSFTVATTESYKDQSGEWKDSTDWHNVVAWDRLADFAAKQLKKGSKVYVEGRIKNRSYEGKDGVTRYITEIVALNLIPMAQGQGGGGAQREYQPSPAAGYSAPEEHISNDFDDEVPF